MTHKRKRNALQTHPEYTILYLSMVSLKNVSLYSVSLQNLEISTNFYSKSPEIKVDKNSILE